MQYLLKAFYLTDGPLVQIFSGPSVLDQVWLHPQVVCLAKSISPAFILSWKSAEEKQIMAYIDLLLLIIMWMSSQILPFMLAF